MADNHKLGEEMAQMHIGALRELGIIPHLKICERCGSQFDPDDERDWYCSPCVGAILGDMRKRQEEARAILTDGERTP